MGGSSGGGERSETRNKQGERRRLPETNRLDRKKERWYDPCGLAELKKIKSFIIAYTGKQK